MTHKENPIDVKDWEGNLRKLAQLHSRENILILAPTKMGKSSQELIAATLKKLQTQKV